jgi:hypothetical protein
LSKPELPATASAAVLDGAIQEQLQRERADEARSREAERTRDRRLAEREMNSRRSNHRWLLSECVTPLAECLAMQFEEFAASPRTAGPHRVVMPLFDPFPSAEYIAVVALRATLDRLYRPQKIASFAQSIGMTVQREAAAVELQRRSPLLGPQLMRRAARLKTMQLPRFLNTSPRWDDRVRLEVGLFLLDAVISSCGLVQFRMKRRGVRHERWVYPAPEAEQVIAATGQSFRLARRPLTCRPKPWTTVDDGGYLNGSSLIKPGAMTRRDNNALDPYRQADLSGLIQVVNAQQELSLTVNPEMVKIQREAWEAGIPGLWPCSRIPMEVPERLPEAATREQIRARNRLAAMAHREREENRSKRIDTERKLQAAEELAGRMIWQAYEADFRGRLYTVSRELTHQGPDHEKALLDFSCAEPATEQGFEWMLRCAATHWGIKGTWGNRFRWGLENRQRMLAVAEDPLNRVELWRSAADPWQFLQAARAVASYSNDPAAPISCPLRFDQTSSGCGILAALVRDQTLARQTNLCGSTPNDLYMIFIERIKQRLLNDLHNSEDFRTQAKAERWLETGITRNLIKAVIVAWPYGSSFMSTLNKMSDELDKQLGYPPIDEYNLKVFQPSKYLAVLINQEIKLHLGKIAGPRKWMMDCVRKMMKAGHHASWISPTGFPVIINNRGLRSYKVVSKMNGQKVTINMQDQDIESKYNPVEANKGIGANLIHSLDAAFCHLMIAKVGPLMPLLTNHDCFATTPANAETLHNQLLLQMRELYMNSWLDNIHEQFRDRTRLKLPAPPIVSTLCPSQIGTNPYLFS